MHEIKKETLETIKHLMSILPPPDLKASDYASSQAKKDWFLEDLKRRISGCVKRYKIENRLPLILRFFFDGSIRWSYGSTDGYMEKQELISSEETLAVFVVIDETFYIIHDRVDMHKAMQVKGFYISFELLHSFLRTGPLPSIRPEERQDSAVKRVVEIVVAAKPGEDAFVFIDKKQAQLKAIDDMVAAREEVRKWVKF